MRDRIVTKVPPHLGEPVAWVPSVVESDGGAQGQGTNFNSRRAVDPNGTNGPHLFTDPVVTLSQTDYASTEAPLQPIADNEADIPVESASLKRPSLLSRIKAELTKRFQTMSEPLASRIRNSPEVLAASVGSACGA